MASLDEILSQIRSITRKQEACLRTAMLPSEATQGFSMGPAELLSMINKLHRVYQDLRLDPKASEALRVRATEIEILLRFAEVGVNQVTITTPKEELEMIIEREMKTGLHRIVMDVIDSLMNDTKPKLKPDARHYDGDDRDQT